MQTHLAQPPNRSYALFCRMIYFDVTKTADAAHRSGLTRVSGRLAGCFGSDASPIRWGDWPRVMRKEDWFLTAELFSEEERPGLTEFLRTATGRKAAIFHDAIPLKLPHVTWPQSVQRHPEYMKMLASFDRVWAVSAASRDELVGFWRWQGITQTPPVDVLALGSDFDGTARVTEKYVNTGPTPRKTTVRELGLRWGVDTPPIFSVAALLCVGIIEPRKNQLLLLDVCEALWDEGIGFDLHVVGRVNPHFGPPIVERILATERKYPGLRYHEEAEDIRLATLYATSRATVFPTLAEGCGLPLLESLWRGVPCVCSDLPVLRENSGGGGCVTVTPDDREAWKNALRSILMDDALHANLTAEARSRSLPTWAEAAAVLTRELSNKAVRRPGPIVRPVP